MTLKSLSPAILALSLFAVGCGGEHGDGDGTPDAEVAAVLALTGDSTNGASVFANTCAACHGSDGVSGYGDDLSSAIPAHSDQAIVEVILYGEDDMPAQSQLSDQEVADVLEYCRDTFGG